MIVICLQIWFLIKFKLQKREWVWLKLGFSHVKGLWQYKYRSQGKEGRRLKGENPRRSPLPKTLKKKKKIFTTKKKLKKEHGRILEY
jgi:hypothetical protein